MKEVKHFTIPPLWIFKLSQRLRLFLRRLELKMVPSAVAVFEKAQGFWISKAIGVACDFGIADYLLSGSKSIEEIAREVNADEKALYRLLRALSSEGIFKEEQGKVFSNTPLSKALADTPGSMKNMIRHQLNQTNWEIIGQLGYSIKTGNCSSKEILGTDIFTHLKKNPEKNEMYNLAMSETSALASAAFLAAYSFNKSGVIVDIGGGEGYLLAAILQKHPHLKGVLFDLPHVVINADYTFQKTGLLERLSIVGGSFFETIPVNGDIYIMKNILHAFDDLTAIAILRNINNQIQIGTKLLLMEAVIEKNNRPAYGKLFDLQMLIGTDGGKERTLEEFETILKTSGYNLNKVIPTVSPFSIVEAVKV